MVARRPPGLRRGVFEAFECIQRESSLRSNSIQPVQRRILTGTSIGFCLIACMAGRAQVGARLDSPIHPAQGAEISPRTFAPASFFPDVPGLAEYSSSAAIAERTVSPLFEPVAYWRDSGNGSALSPVEASRTERFIETDQPVPALGTRDMVLLGMRDSFSPMSIAGWFTSAGYEQLMNSSPNYGRDRGAFGERLGAAAICNSTEGILSESVMAPMLHEDPRYYRLGPGHNFFLRAIYAGTRPIITRTNGGRTTPNFALIAGNAEGSLLTNLYYPQVNRGPEQTMETLGLSIGGSVIGDVVGEFYGDFVHLFHSRRP
jgi:hypothetical protein